MADSHLLVGYTATSTGRDALRLGIALAREQNAEIHVVMVAPQDSAYSGAYPVDRSFNPILTKQLNDWLDEAVAEVPEDLTVRKHLVWAESDPQGLLKAVADLNASMIVIGSRRGGLLRRYRVGSVANTLLHSAHVPVALAPAGYAHPGPLGRLTAMFGPRPGGDDVIDLAIDAVRRRDIPLRLVSLVMLDIPDEQSDTEAAANTEAINMGVLNSVAQYGDDRLAAAASELVRAGTARTRIATGRTVENALADLDWQDDEVVVVGSSRLAAQGQLFLSSKASKMLRSAPVPMVVVPSGHTRNGSQTP